MKVPNCQALIAPSVTRRKVLVLGATGPTGQQILAEAADRGYELAALVRKRTTTSYPPSTDVFTGDARDEIAVSRALEGCDGVICALGTSMNPFRTVTVLSSATQVLTQAMRRQRVRRLVCITGVGAGDSRGHGGFFYDRLMQPLLLRQIYKDKDRQENIVRASGLDWILVRPAILQDAPGTGRVFAQTDLSRIRGGRIARADVAKFVVDQLIENTWLHRAPLIMSNRRVKNERIQQAISDGL
jgi:putative NADH-flavin reductase